MNALRKKLAELTTQYGTAYSKLEQKAGLSENFIRNILRGKSKSPGIEGVIKLAKALDISIDELVGLPQKKSFSYSIKVDNKDLLLESMNHIMKEVINCKTDVYFSDILKAIYELYDYSTKQETVDAKFAKWCIETYVLKQR